MNRPKVDLDLRPFFSGEARGHVRKSLIVLHETVSHDAKGLSDIAGVAGFMDREGLEIHGIIDIEANSGWAYDRRAIYDHVASNGHNINTSSIGFEQVSDVPFLSSNAAKIAAWDPKGPRRKQLLKQAQWIAWLSTVEDIPLRYSDGLRSGVTTHWQISETFDVPGGHTDCHSKHLGGYYPVLFVINAARQILEGGGV